MKQFRMLLAAAFVAGSLGTAHADRDHDSHTISIFTPPLRGIKFVCATLNASNKTLGVVINLIDETGVMFNTVSQSVAPGQSFDDGPPVDAPNGLATAYCRVDVSGGDSDDVRVDLGGFQADGKVLQGVVQGH